IIGVGAIGSYLANAIHAGKAGATSLLGVADIPQTEPRLREVAERCGCKWETDPLRLTELEPDIVIEAAAQQALRQYAIPLLERGVDLLAMSVGALADPDFLAQLQAAIVRTGRKLYVPSGAIGGIDVLRAAAVDGIEEARLTTTKPPAGLRGAPYLEEHPVDLDAIQEPTTLFKGSVADAVHGFPQNVNVAAILNLASTGAKSISVEVVADPGSDRNVHEIYARGTFGEMTLRVANVPSPDNPKTSHLACLSPLALLRRLSAQVVVGS
ncbi:MAG: aspartate dehydrogenase, partial [Chloroflexota bacterium]